MKQRARSLRKNMTHAEHRIWYFLRNRRLCGYKFTRQLRVGHYFADFICREKALIIEIDGSQHMGSKRYDDMRSKYLHQEGYRVLRFWNNEVLTDIDNVLAVILNELENS